MSMKKTDLEKNKAMKIVGTMKSSLAPDRFAQGAAAAQDKKERRARDAAAGLVPFACKLPVELARQLGDRAAAHEGGLNGLMAALVEKGLNDKPVKGSPAKDSPAKDSAAKDAPAKDAPAKDAPVKAKSAK
jgi:hypothetical protein